MNVLIFGTFDHLHPGHKYVIQNAYQRGSVSIVVARDTSVQAIKGHAPAQSEEHRKLVLEREYPSAKVVLGDAHDYLTPVRELRPDLILLGYDQKLPPGIHDTDLPCPVERLPALEPDKYKSSLLRKKKSEEGR